MPCGRMTAQAAHLTAKLAKKFSRVHAMTTIILEVENSYALDIVPSFLKFKDIGFVEQHDDFPPSPDRILQAVATVPITRKQADMLTGFNLWSCFGSCAYSSVQSTRY